MIWRYVLHYPFPLDEDAMRLAAAKFVGVHDFTSFAASTGSEEDDKERVMDREIFSTELVRSPLDDQELVFTVHGRSFLRYMVSKMVGTLLHVGQGKLTPDDLDRLFELRDRSKSGPTVPPRKCRSSSPGPNSRTVPRPRRSQNQSERYSALPASRHSTRKWSRSGGSESSINPVIRGSITTAEPPEMDSTTLFPTRPTPSIVWSARRLARVSNRGRMEIGRNRQPQRFTASIFRPSTCGRIPRTIVSTSGSSGMLLLTLSSFSVPARQKGNLAITQKSWRPARSVFCEPPGSVEKCQFR